MSTELRNQAEIIIKSAIDAVCPDRAVRRAMENISLTGRIYIVSTGKAGWQMAKAATEFLEEKGIAYEKGLVITKYGHVMGPLPKITCFEAGHPVPDENSFYATGVAIDMVSNLKCDDTVLFLLSGGGSALFEVPLIDASELSSITSALLASGADIIEMNTIRKRLSKVKGGRFGQICQPARVETIVLSDIVGDPLDMIASGPAYADTSTSAEAVAIAEKYKLPLSDQAWELLKKETPKSLDHVNTQIIGSVRELCMAAESKCKELGYKTYLLKDDITCEARDEGIYFAKEAKKHAESGEKIALIAGGETVVHLKGRGLGGRNQELAFAAMREISKEENMAVFSVGSDGTDGPTDAAGGYVDNTSFQRLLEAGLDFDEILGNNDCYHGLKAIDGLIFTGPTGTNVNDFWVALLS